MAEQSGSRFLMGSLVVVMLGATGAAVFMGMKHREAAGRELALVRQSEKLRAERDEQSKAASAMAAEREAATEEAERIRQESQATVAALRQQITEMEKQATSVQEQLARAKSGGPLQANKVAELQQQLDQTRASAEQAQAQLKTLGYAKDELSDQVAKLRTRMTATDADLQAARRLAQIQEQKIRELNTNLAQTGVVLIEARSKNDELTRANEDLLRELSLRPKRSIDLFGATYRPSVDRKAPAPKK
jgi:chromosome segregation ATPase